MLVVINEAKQLAFSIDAENDARDDEDDQNFIFS